MVPHALFTGPASGVINTLFSKCTIIWFQRRPQGSVLGVYGEEGLFMVCPFGQNTGSERVGRTFGTAQYWVPLILGNNHMSLCQTGRRATESI